MIGAHHESHLFLDYILVSSSWTIYRPSAKSIFATEFEDNFQTIWIWSAGASEYFQHTVIKTCRNVGIDVTNKCIISNRHEL